MNDKTKKSFGTTIQAFGYAIFLILSVISALVGLLVILGPDFLQFSDKLTAIEFAIGIIGRIILGIIVFFIGFFASKVLTSFIIGFGELIEDTREINISLNEIKESLLKEN